MNWPRIEDDFMEYGNTGWVAIGEGRYKNIYTGNIMNENGAIFLVDEQGNIVSQIEES